MSINLSLKKNSADKRYLCPSSSNPSVKFSSVLNVLNGSNLSRLNAKLIIHSFGSAQFVVVLCIHGDGNRRRRIVLTPMIARS